MTSVKLQYDDLMNPVLQALKSLGGSGTIEEINTKVAEIAKIPSEQLEVLHNPEKGGMTEIEYRLMWTRTYLKIYGVIENSVRGVWSLTEKGSKIEKVEEKDVVRVVREQMKKNKKDASEEDDEPTTKVEWQEELLGCASQVLFKLKSLVNLATGV
jgi:restriction system protein